MSINFYLKIAYAGLCFMLSFTGFMNAYAQDAQFSQYLTTGVYLNPGLSSAVKNVTLVLNHRNQWNSLVAPYSTTQISLVKPLYLNDRSRSKLGGIGISFYNDKTGDGILKEMGGSINGSYNLRVNNLNSVFFGLQLGFIQKSLNYDQLTWGNQYTNTGFDPNKDPEVGIKNYSTIYPDFSAGLVYSFNAERNYGKHGAGYSSRVGISIYHMNSPNESFFREVETSRLPMLMKIHGDIEVVLADNLYLNPAMLVLFQNQLSQVNSGLHLIYMIKKTDKSLWKPTQLIAGLWYRINDSFIFIAGFGNNFYRLSLSYDMNTTFMREYSYGTGAYEIALSISPFKEKRKSASSFYYHRK